MNLNRNDNFGTDLEPEIDEDERIEQLLQETGLSNIDEEINEKEVDKIDPDDFKIIGLSTENVVKTLENELGPDAKIKEKITIIQDAGGDTADALTDAMASGDLTAIKKILTANDNRLEDEFVNSKEELSPETEKKYLGDNFSDYFSKELSEFRMLKRDPDNTFATADLFFGNKSMTKIYPEKGTYYTVDNKVSFSGETARNDCLLAAQKFALQETESWIKDNLFKDTNDKQQACFWEMLNANASANPSFAEDVLNSLKNINAGVYASLTKTAKEHFYIDFDVYEKVLPTSETQYLIHAHPNVIDMAADFLVALKNNNLLTRNVKKNLTALSKED